MKLKIINAPSKTVMATAVMIVCLVCGLETGNATVSPNVHQLQSAVTSSTVYITPKGQCYHSTSSCPTLSRSKIVHAVDKRDAMKTRRACKVCH